MADEDLLWPVASEARLDELGLNKRKFGCCATVIQENTPNVGRVTIRRGCRWASQQRDGFSPCPWQNNTKYMSPKDDKDKYPRPRNLRVRHVKPRGDGMTDIVIDSYCSCFQWHQDLKRRNKKNGELAAVTGGEGEMVRVRVPNKIANPDGTFYFGTKYEAKAVPRFPDPTENPALSEAVFAAEAKLEINEDQFAVQSAEDAERLGLKSGEDIDTGNETGVSVAKDDPDRPRFGKGSRGGG